MAHRKILLLVLISLLIISCNSLWVPRHIKQSFTNCYDGKNTGLDTLISVVGYYRMWQEYDRYGINAVYEHQLDTIYSYFLLYPDGIIVDFFSSGGKNVDDLINDIISTSNRGKKHSFFSYNNWGCYSIKGDTIISQNVNHARSLNQYYGGYEKKYKIIDKNTLLLIEHRSLSKIPPLSTIELGYQEQRERERDFENAFDRKSIISDTANFIPLKEIPPSDCWLKEKRWFWCDKEKFKKWKSGVKY